MKIFASFLLAVVLAFAGPAHAGKWLRAESPNFIVYGERDESSLREVIQSLEQFDVVLRQLGGVRRTEENGNKLEIYLLRNKAAPREVAPGIDQDIFAFYSARPDLIAAFVPFASGDTTRETYTTGGSRIVRSSAFSGFDGQDVLFHEYVHHFMFAHMPGAHPQWWSEGFAEFVGTTEITAQRVELGHVPQVRAEWLKSELFMPLETILKPTGELSDREIGLFYAKSWLFVHYLFSTPERRSAGRAYLDAINAGGDPIAVFQPAFGKTVQEVDGELRRYQGQNMLRGFGFQRAAPIPDSAIVITRLPDSMEDLLLAGVRARLGRSERPEFAARIRGIAARYPGDAQAALTAAWATYATGDFAGTVTAVDAVLAAKPDHPDALCLKGLALISAAAAAPDTRQARNAEARRVLARANCLAPERTHMLFRYGQTFQDEPVTENLLNVLRLSNQLAPQVPEITLYTARLLMAAGQFEEAAKVLTPLAYSAHRGRSAERALVMRASALRREQPPADTGGEDDAE